MLDASVAAHRRARALDAKIVTSVMHTWFMQGDCESLTTVPIADFPYMVALAFVELGRGG